MMSFMGGTRQLQMAMRKTYTRMVTASGDQNFWNTVTL